ncbi:MAG: hypothetical protein IKA36_02090 [Clostridia bacterium]|nr:hypothetical protein [Clostridia bacterium]
MIKYIESTSIYAAWMIRNQTMSISNLTLSFINTQLVENLKKKNEYHIFNLGEYDGEYFEKNDLGLICKEGITPSTLMNLISNVDMDTYLDISNTIQELDFDPTTTFNL